MDLKKLIIELFKIIYIIILIYVAYQVLRAIIGGTWTTENIIIAGMGVILAGMFAIVGFLINQGKCLGILEKVFLIWEATLRSIWQIKKPLRLPRLKNFNS